jgi:hypothetical protein
MWTGLREAAVERRSTSDPERARNGVSLAQTEHRREGFTLVEKFGGGAKMACRTLIALLLVSR